MMQRDRSRAHGSDDRGVTKRKIEKVGRNTFHLTSTCGVLKVS